MNRDSTESVDGVSRRSVLAAGASGLALSTSGCIDRVQSVVDDDGDEQVSFSILTVPADGDRENVQIARHLESNLEAVGVDVSVDMRSRSELLEAVLVDHDFDCYVGLHPADYDPDFLYEALHSKYAHESGWQNPFGYETGMRVDRLLERQRAVDGDDRVAEVNALLRAITRRQPFVPICVPEEYRIARTDGRFAGWEAAEGHLASRSGYLALEPEDDTERLHALVTDSRVSRNLNPLSATLRERGTTIDLLYDSLLTEHDGDCYPWLAEEVEWIDEDEGSATAAITLREGCLFHDSEPDDEHEVTADDVKFTYEFLADTADGEAEVPSPAPRYRSHASAIDRIEVDGPYELVVTTTTGTEVGERALTAPILPEERWEDQIESRSDDDDFEAEQGEWGLVTMSNIPPTGSGPYRYVDHSGREYLTLERFDDHFTLDDDVGLHDDIGHLAPAVEEIRFTVDPGSRSSIERVASGNADVTASMLDASTVRDVRGGSDVARLESPSRTFYHLGFNTRTEPFSAPRFRRAVARLIDREHLVENVFDTHATPVATPVTGEWVPAELEWDDEAPELLDEEGLLFPGSGGELDLDRAKAAFEMPGYRYVDGRLLGRD